jgi:hypothetical protein
MRFSIEAAQSQSDLVELGRLHQAVFVEELKLPLDGILGTRESSLHLLARDPFTGEAVGALTVVDTTSDLGARQRFELPFPAEATTARLARLAVLPRYRGLNAHLQLILRARESFIERREIEFSWLLFDPDRAAGSKICRLLGFRVANGVVPTEYGPQRVMFRDERAPESEHADRVTAQYISACIAQSAGSLGRLGDAYDQTGSGDATTNRCSFSQASARHPQPAFRSLRP